MKYLFLFPLIVLFACGTTKTGEEPSEPEVPVIETERRVVKSTEETLWINSSRIDCVDGHHGVRLSCYTANRADDPATGEWMLLDQYIGGFDYEPGNLYRVRLRRDSFFIPEILMDARSIEYSLVEELEKRPARADRLHDIWVLENFGDGAVMDFTKLKSRPRLEFFVAEKRLGGTDGCNRIMGSLETVDQTNLVFGPLAGTKMMCPDMEIPDRLKEVLTATRRYELRELKLLLLDDKNQELARFQKVD